MREKTTQHISDKHNMQEQQQQQQHKQETTKTQ